MHAGDAKETVQQYVGLSRMYAISHMHCAGI
jgi:hypothetical protein